MPQLSELYQLNNYIDTFALGHYARVLDARDRRSGATVAFKVMRPEHLDPQGDMRWEYSAFGNEAEILARLRHSPNIVKLYDCGFISDTDEAPRQGEIASYKDRHFTSFSKDLPRYAQAGWRPYLSLEYLPRHQSLFYLMKPNRPDSRWRLPSEEGLALALQFSALLSLAHSMQIVYLDHKLEHVYWDGAHLKVIDFNSSRMSGERPRPIATAIRQRCAQYVRRRLVFALHRHCRRARHPAPPAQQPGSGRGALYRYRQPGLQHGAPT